MAQSETLESGPPVREPPATSISRGRLGTVGALLLALGASFPSQKSQPDTTSSPDMPAHGLTRPIDAALRTAGTRPAMDITVEDFRVDGNHFTCMFGPLPVFGDVAENGEISSVRFGTLSIHLHDPVTENTLERLLRSATGTAALLRVRGVTPHDGKMETLGGARFLFATGADDRAQLAMATVRDILAIDPADETERDAAEIGWKNALRNLTALSPAQNDAIDARIEVHNGRMRTIYDDLTRRTEYDNWYYWQQRRNEFAQGWNAVVAQWKDAGIDERGTLLRSFHEFLDSWERPLSLQPEMEAENAFRERYEKLVRDLTELRTREKTLRERAHMRRLQDTARGLTITERSSHLSPKNFTREYRSGANLLLRRQTYEDDVLTQETEYDRAGNITNNTLAQYFPGGQLRRAQEYAPKDGKSALQRQTDYWRNGNTRSVLDLRSDAFAYFGESGTLLFEDVASSNRAKRERGMVDAKGERFGLYSDERAKNPALTPSQYLDILAQKLDTEEKLAVFFEQFLWYAYDDGDYWQTAEETVQRTEEDGQKGARYMRCDCDDYAFLARAILRRQGKNAHVLGIPSHAICVWVETDAEGKYNARSLDTFGFDVNGNRYGPDYSRDRKNAHGFAKLIDALNALMKKYRYPGIGVAEGQDYTLDPANITILPNPPAGTYRSVTADYFLQKAS